VKFYSCPLRVFCFFRFCTGAGGDGVVMMPRNLAFCFFVYFWEPYLAGAVSKVAQQTLKFFPWRNVLLVWRAPYGGRLSRPPFGYLGFAAAQWPMSSRISVVFANYFTC